MGAARIALLTRGVAYLRERGMSMGCGFAVGTYHVRMRLSRQRRLPCLGVPIAFRGVLNTFATPWRLAGGSPAASYLLCLAPRRPPKKVTEERRPRDAAFLRRVPTKIGQEAGNETNSPSAQTCLVPYPLPAQFLWRHPSGTPRMQCELALPNSTDQIKAGDMDN